MNTEFPDASAQRIPCLCALLTCFNRREMTVNCLAALARASEVAGVQLHAVLVDDGSTDGTADAVAAAFPWVRIVPTGGNLYWCRGMHVAFEVARSDRYDHYLWLNDDTQLMPDALARLFDSAHTVERRDGEAAIIVGSTVDATSGVLSYGGERRASWYLPLTLHHVQPTDQPQACETFNGNIVLIPRAVAERLGNISPEFEHAMGDTDYGLRARRAGIGIYVGAGVHGTCSGNPPTNTFKDASLSLRRRWQLMMSRKGLPWRSWLVLTRRHAGPFWPVYFSWPYVKLLAGRYGRR